MRPEDIDQLFRESAEAAEFEFDPKEWQKAKALLPKKKKRRWLPLLFLGLGLGSIILILYPYNENGAVHDNVAELIAPMPAGDKVNTSPLKIANSTNTSSLPDPQSAPAQDASDIKQFSLPTSNSKYTKSVVFDAANASNGLNSTYNGQALRKVVMNQNQFLPTIPVIPSLQPTINWHHSIEEPVASTGQKSSTYKKWELGISVSGVLSHHEGGSKGIGSSLGITIRKNLRSGAYLELLPRLVWTSGYEHLVSRNSQRIYGLESHDKIYGQQLRHLTQIEFPLRVGINLNKWRLGVGPTMGLLLDGSGDILELSSPDDDYKTTATLSSGRFDKKDISNINFGISTNANFSFSRVSEIGIEISTMSRQFFTDDFNELNQNQSWRFNITYNHYID